MRINGVVYTSLTAMQGVVREDVVAFLTEWYDSQAYVNGHTSGSTGVPKPVALLKSDMQASARLTNSYLGIDAQSTLLLCLSSSYIAGKMMIVRAIEAGAELIVVPPSSTPINHLRQPITMAAMVPMQVSETLSMPDGVRLMSQIANLLVGGSPVSEELEQKLMALPNNIYVTYGMTETVSHVALRCIGETYYTAIGDVTFHIDNRCCLVVDAPQLSGKQFVTNDMVELVGERQFKWLGRYDNVIMSGGLKFCAEQLERKIASIISHRYYITAADDERLGQHIVLVIESAPYDDAQMQQLKSAMSDLLDRYEYPREIRFVAQLQETGSGKIKRM